MIRKPVPSGRNGDCVWKMPRLDIFVLLLVVETVGHHQQQQQQQQQQQKQLQQQQQQQQQQQKQQQHHRSAPVISLIPKYVPSGRDWDIVGKMPKLGIFVLLLVGETAGHHQQQQQQHHPVSTEIFMIGKPVPIWNQDGVSYGIIIIFVLLLATADHLDY